MTTEITFLNPNNEEIDINTADFNTPTDGLTVASNGTVLPNSAIEALLRWTPSIGLLSVFLEDVQGKATRLRLTESDLDDLLMDVEANDLVYVLDGAHVYASAQDFLEQNMELLPRDEPDDVDGKAKAIVRGDGDHTITLSDGRFLVW